MWYYLIFSLFQALLFAAIMYGKAVFQTKGTKRFYFWSTLIWFVFIGIVNYNAMPVLRFWGYEGVWIETFFTSALGFAFAYMFYIDASGEYWSVKEERKKRRQKLKRFSKAWFIEYKQWGRAIPLAITIIAAIVAAIQSWEMFNASKFANRLQVEVVADSTFSQTIAAVPVEKMITVDDELAKKVAEDVLGNNTGLGSRVQIGNVTLQNLSGSFTINGGKRLTFDNDLYWVAPLEHSGKIKYLSNKTTPGYVLIDATNSDVRYLVTEVNGRPLALRYIESALFNDDIERHIRSNGYLSTGLNDHCFEIDSAGTPYWVLSSYRQTVGFAGEESVGPITVNAETGEIKAYTIANAPEWIDRIQPKEFIEEQVRQWGSLQNGWWNSTWLSKQENVMEPTPGMTLVYSGGRSYWYTGVKSVSADKATNGFMLIDTRTKAAKFYKTSGFNETEAMNIAEGQPEASAAKYKATYPVLYNVRGVPTYFMTYKDMSGNIQGYCFVSSLSRTSVGCDKLKTVAVQKYMNSLRAHQQDNLADSQVVTEELFDTIRGITQDGDMYYILLEHKRGYEFYGKSSTFPELKWTSVGDIVDISFKIGEEISVPIETFNNVDFNI